MWAAALRRIVVLFVAVAGTVTLVSLGIGAVADVSINRAISLGFYISGCFTIGVAFLFVLRGPMRPADDTFLGMSIPFLGVGSARTATHGEQVETLNMAAICFVLGFSLLLVGIAVDSRYRLL